MLTQRSYGKRWKEGLMQAWVQRTRVKDKYMQFLQSLKHLYCASVFHPTIRFWLKSWRSLKWILKRQRLDTITFHHRFQNAVLWACWHYIMPLLLITFIVLTPFPFNRLAAIATTVPTVCKARMFSDYCPVSIASILSLVIKITGSMLD